MRSYYSFWFPKNGRFIQPARNSVSLAVCQAIRFTYVTPIGATIARDRPFKQRSPA